MSYKCVGWKCRMDVQYFVQYFKKLLLRVVMTDIAGGDFFHQNPGYLRRYIAARNSFRGAPFLPYGVRSSLSY